MPNFQDFELAAIILGYKDANSARHYEKLNHRRVAKLIAEYREESILNRLDSDIEWEPSADEHC